MPGDFSTDMIRPLLGISGTAFRPLRSKSTSSSTGSTWLELLRCRPVHRHAVQRRHPRGTPYRHLPPGPVCVPGLSGPAPRGHNSGSARRTGCPLPAHAQQRPEHPEAHQERRGIPSLAADPRRCEFSWGIKIPGTGRWRYRMSGRTFCTTRGRQRQTAAHPR